MAFEAVLYLAVLILAAKLLGEAMHRIGQPTIIGNVLAGIIVGPALFGLVQPIDEIDLFISIGVFFLFFLIGLEEINLTGLIRVMRGRIFAGAVIGFLIPFFAAVLFGISIDISFAKSFAIASVIGASSLGVTAKILTDLGKLKSTIGLEIFTITGIVEFIAIIFTSVIIQLDTTGESTEIFDIGWLFLKMIIFFAIAVSLSVFVFPHIFRTIRKHLKVQQIYFGLVIGFILLVAYFAEISGIHGAIGALLLGIAVSRLNREEYFEISKGVNAIGYGVFIPIFFAGIGLHFSHSFLELPIWVIGGFLVIIIGVKFIGSYIAVKVAHMRPAVTVAYGVMAKGAVDLALMLSLLSSEIIEDKLFSLLVFGTLITMIVSSVNLQRKLKKYVHVKVGTSELGLIPGFFRRAASDYTAKQVMIPEYLKIRFDTNLDEFLEKHGDELKKSPFLVFDEHENLIGAISKKDTQRIDKGLHGTAKIWNVMYHKIHTVTPNEYLFSVIQKMNSHPFDVIPVVEHIGSKKVVGLVTGDSVMKILLK